jgi:hypothetical protein
MPAGTRRVYEMYRRKSWSSVTQPDSHRGSRARLGSHLVSAPHADCLRDAENPLEGGLPIGAAPRFELGTSSPPAYSAIGDARQPTATNARNHEGLSRV